MPDVVQNIFGMNVLPKDSVVRRYYDINDKIYQGQFAMQWETHKQPNGNQINTTTINN